MTEAAKKPIPVLKKLEFSKIQPRAPTATSGTALTATASSTTTPTATVSSATIPTATAIPATVPSATQLTATVPSATAPTATVPSGSVPPSKALPAKVHTFKALPVKVAPVKALPATVPSLKALPGTVPSVAILETLPSATTTSETVPSLQALPATAPSLKALPGTAPSLKALPGTAPSLKALPATVPSFKALPATAPSFKALPATAPSLISPSVTLARASLTTATAVTAVSTAQATKAATKTVTTVTTTAPTTNTDTRKVFQKFRPVSTKLNIATEVTQEKIENARAGDKTVIDHISADEAVEIYKLMKEKKVSKDDAIRRYLENSDERLYNPKAVYLFPGDKYTPRPEEETKERAMHHRPLFPGEIFIPADNDNDKDFYQIGGSLSRSGSTPSITQLYESEERVQESDTNLSYLTPDVPEDRSIVVPPPAVVEKEEAMIVVEKQENAVIVVEKQENAVIVVEQQQQVVVEPEVQQTSVVIQQQEVDAIMPIRRVVIGQKKDPDQEALEHAILLSQQEQAFGVNMYDSLTKADKVTMKKYMAQGFSRQESALVIFEQKHGHMEHDSFIPAMPTLTTERGATRGGGGGNAHTASVSDEEEIEILIKCGYTREQAIVVKRQEDKKRFDTQMHEPHPLEEQFNLTEVEEREVQHKMERKGYSRSKAVEKVVKMRKDQVAVERVKVQQEQQDELLQREMMMMMMLQQQQQHPQMMPSPYYVHQNPSAAALYGSMPQYSQYDPSRLPLQYHHYPFPPLYGPDTYMEPQSYYPEPQSYYSEPQSYHPDPQSYEPQSYYSDPQSYHPEPQSYYSEPQSYFPELQSCYHEPQSFDPELSAIPDSFLFDQDPQPFYPESQSMYHDVTEQQQQQPFYAIDDRPYKYYPEQSPMDFNQSSNQLDDEWSDSSW